jgi:hypothetical protein
MLLISMKNDITTSIQTLSYAAILRFLVEKPEVAIVENE